MSAVVDFPWGKLISVHLLRAWCLWILVSVPVYAHDSRPLYIEINEIVQNTFAVHWKVPVSLPLFAIPDVVMPEDCIATSARQMHQRGDGYSNQASYHCERGVSGQEVILRYPNNNPSISALLRVSLWNGEIYSQILWPAETTWRVPEAENLWRVSYQYTLLGIEHIFAGIDHLLFVLCLVFIARTWRRILITITGFTLAHSLTLALASLDMVSLPVAPVEAVIALSIVFLAHEIAVDHRDSLTWRYPVVVSSSFGLLHGFGFASVLGEIGLPQTEQAAALLFFNVGVEVGQIVFVLAAAALAWLVARLAGRPVMELLQHRHSTLVGSYVIGALASFWMVDRILQF